MDFADSINEYLDSSCKVLGTLDVGSIDCAIGMLLQSYDAGSAVYIFGNGGSAATASHLACDFNKCLFLDDRKSFGMICLNDSIPTMMAYANDCGYDTVFERQLRGRLKKGDVLICISGSGQSANVIRAAEYAGSCGNRIISMTGFSGGRLKDISDCSIHVPIDDQQKVEDCHMLIGHLMMRTIGKEIGHPMFQ